MHEVEWDQEKHIVEYVDKFIQINSYILRNGVSSGFRWAWDNLDTSIRDDARNFDSLNNSVSVNTPSINFNNNSTWNCYCLN